jgi:hypothetical protein
MNSAQIYLPTVLPQWGIFAGVVLITIGYVDKKSLWTRLGWIVLIATSMAALYFNLFGGFSTLTDKAEPDSVVVLLTSTGWLAVAGGVLAIISLLMLQFRTKRYPLLAILSIIYFILIFFLYYQVSAISGKEIRITPQTDQKQ